LKIKNVLLSVPLSLAMLAPLAPTTFAQQPDTPATTQQDKLQSDQAKLAKSKAMNPQEEQKKLKELGLDGKRIKLIEGEPLVLNFDDGSRIEYTISSAPTPADRLPVVEEGTISTQAIIYKTYNVKKQYFYASANANTGLYTDVKHDGRYVYVRQNNAFFEGTLMANNGQETRTIDGTGYGTDVATTELKGSFTATGPYVGDYYTRTYLYRMDIDPAGLCWIRVIY
jgi:hypothetical protein